MPARATLDQRVDWHIEHTRHCGCREMPATIQAEIARRSKEKRPPSAKR